MSEVRPQDVRPSALAGRWYPGEPERLAAVVDDYLAAAAVSLEGEVVAVMAPHAGYVYSGAVAGCAFATVRGGRPEVVAVVGLGDVPVDGPGLHALDAALRVRLGQGLTRVRRDPEHSVEIELPFLQRALGGPFRLLPVMVREQARAVVEALGGALAETLAGRAALLVASTDLSHYAPQEVAERLDRELLRRIAAFDPVAVLDAEAEGVGFACGIGALAAVLWAARALGADRAVVLRHATSGDVTGDRSDVVGYGAAALVRTGRPPA
jgi:predicted class III extradiol MEMO1 family dioxygenase